MVVVVKKTKKQIINVCIAEPDTLPTKVGSYLDRPGPKKTKEGEGEREKLVFRIFFPFLYQEIVFGPTCT